MSWSQYLGAPAVLATFVDESDNKTLADVSRACHSMVWERDVLLRMRHQRDEDRVVIARRG